jgi:hypothetical protein
MSLASRRRENLLRFGSIGKIDLTSGERIEAKRPVGHRLHAASCRIARKGLTMQAEIERKRPSNAVRW